MNPNETFEQSVHQELSDSHILWKIARLGKLSDKTKARVHVLLSENVFEKENILSSLTVYLANTSEDLLWVIIENCHLLDNMTQENIELLIFSYHLWWKKLLINMICEKEEYSQVLKNFLQEKVIHTSESQANDFLEKKYRELLT